MIREAILSDIPRIVEMSVGFYNTAVKDKGLGFSPIDLYKYTESLIRNEIGGVFVLEIDDKLVGSIAGIITPWFMDFSTRLVMEQWWWVEPSYRGNEQSVLLIDALIKWGRSRRANKIMMVSIGSDKEKAVQRYYRRLGFKYVETQYIKEI